MVGNYFGKGLLNILKMNWSFFKSSKSLAPFLGQAYLGIIKIGRVSPYLLNKVKILAY